MDNSSIALKLEKLKKNDDLIAVFGKRADHHIAPGAIYGIAFLIYIVLVVGSFYLLRAKGYNLEFKPTVSSIFFLVLFLQIFYLILNALINLFTLKGREEKRRNEIQMLGQLFDLDFAILKKGKKAGMVVEPYIIAIKSDSSSFSPEEKENLLSTALESELRQMLPQMGITLYRPKNITFEPKKRFPYKSNYLIFALAIDQQNITFNLVGVKNSPKIILITPDCLKKIDEIKR